MQGLNRPCAVLVYGAGSGFGKSTLVTELVRQLETQGFTVRRFSEESVLELPAFRAYVQQVEVGEGQDTRTLLASCKRFVHDLAALDTDIIVLNSILPCWDWLYSAGADDTAVLAFTKALNVYFEGLTSVLVLLEGNLERALDRATKERGLVWALNLAEHRTGRRSRAGLERYFRKLRLGTERMPPSWQYPIVRIDTVVSDTRSSLHQIYLALAEFMLPLS